MGTRTQTAEERGIQTEFTDTLPRRAPVTYREGKKKPSGHVFSFFSGCGFLDLGFEKEGFEIVIANEISEEFSRAHLFSRQQMEMSLPTEGYHQGSIAELMNETKQAWFSKQVERYKKKGLVGFIGGPPCPDFSVGGKNKGRDGERGKLTKTYFDLIMRQSPDWFLFENVKGLWRTKRHREFYEEMKAMAMANGYSVAEKLINAIEYGVGQDRDRIIMVGFKDTVLGKHQIEAGKEIPSNQFPWLRYACGQRTDIFALPWPETNKFGADVFAPQVPRELTVNYWFDRNKVDSHPNAIHVFTPRQGLARFLSVDEGDDSKKSYKRLHRWRYSPTACYGNNEVHLHPTLPRRITVAEALALQSLPAEYVLPPSMTLSAMFKTIGNGVPFLAAQALAKTIRDFIR